LAGEQTAHPLSVFAQDSHVSWLFPFVSIVRRPQDGATTPASLLRFNLSGLLQLLFGAPDDTSLPEVTSENYYATARNKSAAQRASVEAALQETKSANLALVVVLTLALAVVACASNLLAA
jgi:hypothetical protein